MGHFIVLQSNLTSNLLEKLRFCFKRSVLSDTHIISTFAQLSICKSLTVFYYNSAEYAALISWKSNPRSWMGHSCHENWIYYSGNVVNRQNGDFSCKNGRKIPCINIKTNKIENSTEEKRILRRELDFKDVNGTN